LFEAARRLAKREAVIRSAREGAAAFVMSLSPGDTIEFAQGKKKGLWIVTGFWSNGQIVLESAVDADHATTTRPNPESLLKDNARKVSVDPIGHIRMAND
jgi:CRISPR-associated endonuclease Csn1